MDIRKLIHKEVLHILKEGYAAKPLPKTFDNLKWSLNNNQKYRLQELCEVDPNSITESDINNAEKFLGIPGKNIKSIINTYGTYKKESYTDIPSGSRMVIGNKPVNAVEMGLTIDDSRLPDLSNNSGKVMHTNSKGISNLEEKQKNDSDEKNRTWYRDGEGKEHNSKIRERFFKKLNTSLMMYLFCESKPKDINLRDDDRIQIDFEPIIEEGNFNQLGSLNYEGEKYKLIKNLLEDFNNRFNCSYVIHDHVSIEGCQRLYIEHNVTKQIDMTQDSMKMMAKYLLPRIMIGEKVNKSQSDIISLMGLDAGDTSWLYGDMSSDLYSK